MRRVRSATTCANTATTKTITKTSIAALHWWQRLLVVRECDDDDYGMRQILFALITSHIILTALLLFISLTLLILRLPLLLFLLLLLPLLLLLLLLFPFPFSTYSSDCVDCSYCSYCSCYSAYSSSYSCFYPYVLLPLRLLRRRLLLRGLKE